MLPVRDLRRMGQRPDDRLAVAAAPAAGHNGDAAMAGEPSFGRRLLAVGKENYGTAPLQVARDGAVAVVAPPGEVVDADHAQRLGGRARAAPNDPQQGVVADRHDEAAREARRRSAAEREAEVMDEVMDEVVKPARAIASESSQSQHCRRFHKLRKAAERTITGLWDAIGRLIDTFTPNECTNYFAAAGYDAT